MIKQIDLVYLSLYDLEPAYGIASLASNLKNQLNKKLSVNQKIISLDMNSFFLKQLLKISLCRKYYFNSLNEYIYMNKKKFFLDMILNRGLKKLKLKNSNIIGFSLFSSSQLLTYLALAKKIKLDYPHEKKYIVFGGAYVKLFHELLDMSKLPFLDFIITSDGEKSFKDLIQVLDVKSAPKNFTNDPFSKISSLIYRFNGKIKNTRININQFEEINHPEFEKTNLSKILTKNKFSLSFGLPYQMSKGCKFKCSFCTHHTLNSIEFNDLDKIIKDINQITKETKFELFRFIDSNINMDINFLKSICHRFIKEKINIKWIAYATPNIDLELLTLMKRAGCLRLYCGIESGSDKILKLMKKPFTTNKISQFLINAKTVGIEIIGSFMIGFPGETKKDYEDTMRFIINKKNYLELIHISKFRLFYNSEIYLNSDKYNIKIKGPLNVESPEKFKYVSNDQSWEKIKKTQNVRFNEAIKLLKKNNISHEYDDLNF